MKHGNWPQKFLLPPSRSGLSNKIWPYHELTEAFPTKDGKPIGEDNPMYDNAKPYDNRDPRFYNTFLYNGAPYVNSNTSSEKIPVHTYRGASRDGYGGTGGATPTGYFYRKGLDESKTASVATEGQGLSFIRYASIMLFYAEALTELDVNANRDKIEKQLFDIRERAGIEAGNDGRYGVPVNMNKDEMIEFIINERRIEFANETGNRFWDLKRRKTYENLHEMWNSAAVWEGEAAAGSSWEIVPTEQHFFYERMYFSAIPQYDINASHGNLIQNPGW